MKNTTILMLAGLLLAGSQVAAAQESEQDRKVRHEQASKMQKMHDEMGMDKGHLTEAQRAQVNAIRDRYKTQHVALKTQKHQILEARQTAKKNNDAVAYAAANAALERNRAEAKALREAQHREMLAVLPADMREMASKRHQEHMKNMNEMEEKKDKQARRADHNRQGHDRREWAKERRRNNKERKN